MAANNNLNMHSMSPQPSSPLTPGVGVMPSVISSTGSVNNSTMGVLPGVSSVIAQTPTATQSAWDQLTASTSTAVNNISIGNSTSLQNSNDILGIGSSIVGNNASIVGNVGAASTGMMISLVAANSPAPSCSSPSTPTKTGAPPLDAIMAHTPQGPPTVSSMHGSGAGSASSYGEELTAELVNQGWRKFWSKRENRPYYWNKITGESLWEMPGLRPFDPLTDPLGELL